jgi:uncharacterized protein
MLRLDPKFFLAAIIIAVTACTSAPPTTFYVLESQISAPAPIADLAKKTVIGVGPVTIPALLERKQIITRSDLNTVNIAEFHQWAAPLRDNITQVLTQNLAGLQSHHVIRAYPWSAYGPVNYRVNIDIDRFDTQPGQSVHLDARWAIMDEKTHSIVTNQQTHIKKPLADSSYPTAVKALSGALNEFSQALSLVLDQLK